MDFDKPNRTYQQVVSETDTRTPSDILEGLPPNYSSAINYTTPRMFYPPVGTPGPTSVELVDIEAYNSAGHELMAGIYSARITAATRKREELLLNPNAAIPPGIEKQVLLDGLYRTARAAYLGLVELGYVGEAHKLYTGFSTDLEGRIRKSR
ncbi:hypothetical protein HY640_02115 [Candidatus Woesearchaeota archaeon]|nr:hypothetical protein [Candidatus Woesearchaeota archaeon]